MQRNTLRASRPMMMLLLLRAEVKTCGRSRVKNGGYRPDRIAASVPRKRELTPIAATRHDGHQGMGSPETARKG